jgi:hypothetical protein
MLLPIKHCLASLDVAVEEEDAVVSLSSPVVDVGDDDS